MTDADTLPPPHPEALQLAARALGLARRGMNDRAAAVVTRVGALGLHAQLTLIYGMADTVISAVQRETGLTSAQPIGPAWMGAASGQVESADEVPPDVRWVGRFLAARWSMDHDMCHALLRAPTTDEEWSACVSRLVEMAALNLNAIEGEPT